MIGAAILSFIVEGVAVATAPAWVPAALGAGALVALGYTSYKVYDKYFAVNQINVDEENEKLIKEEEEKENNEKKGRRNRNKPDSKAVGDHSVFRRDPNTNEITHYETYRPQTNPRNPNKWETVKRYDAQGKPHTNKVLDKKIQTLTFMILNIREKLDRRKFGNRR